MRQRFTQGAGRLCQVQAIPTVVVIDREGKVSSPSIGAQTEGGLRAALAKAGIDSLRE